MFRLGLSHGLGGLGGPRRRLDSCLYSLERDSRTRVSDFFHTVSLAMETDRIGPFYEGFMRGGV